MSYPGSEEADGTEQRIPSEPGEWEEYTPGISEAPPRHGRPRTYAAMGTAEEFRGKTLHDKPPQWNGENAERDLKPYLKELSLWLKTTETPKKRQGLAIMGYASGKLKQSIDALDEDEIANESGGAIMLEHIKSQYQHYVDKRLPIALDRVLYHKQAFRYQNEGMLEYLARKKRST